MNQIVDSIGSCNKGFQPFFNCCERKFVVTCITTNFQWVIRIILWFYGEGHFSSQFFYKNDLFISISFTSLVIGTSSLVRIISFTSTNLAFTFHHLLSFLYFFLANSSSIFFSFWLHQFNHLQKNFIVYNAQIVQYYASCFNIRHVPQRCFRSLYYQPPSTPLYFKCQFHIHHGCRLHKISICPISR